LQFVPTVTTTIPDFTSIRELYRSSAGAVYSARFKYDNKKYVLKERSLPELGKRKDIMNEVNLLSQLDHPNVVRCEGFFRDESRKSLFIVLEYCPGGDLKSVIDAHKAQGAGRDRYLDDRLIWHLFVQICEGLKHLHEHGIVHRDLKTMNIMVVQTETKFVAKIADLGVSRQLSDDTMMLQTFYGTPLYLSPELVENKQYNEKTDIWSLGVILYELICLTHPFKSSTLLGLAKLVCSGKYDALPDHVDKNLARCVKWLLNVDFMKRPNIVQLIRYVNEQCTPGYPWKQVDKHSGHVNVNSMIDAAAGFQLRPPTDLNRSKSKGKSNADQDHLHNNLAIDVDNVDRNAQGAPTADTVEIEYEDMAKANSSNSLKSRPNLADGTSGNVSASGRRRGDNAGVAAPEHDQIKNAAAAIKSKNGDIINKYLGDARQGIGMPDAALGPGAGDEGGNPYDSNGNQEVRELVHKRPATSSGNGSRRSSREENSSNPAKELPARIYAEHAPAAREVSPSPNYRSVSGNDNKRDLNSNQSATPAQPKQNPNRPAGIGGWDRDGYDFPTTEEMMQVQGFVHVEPLNPNARHISRNPDVPATSIDSPNRAKRQEKGQEQQQHQHPRADSRIRLNKKGQGLCSPRSSKGEGQGNSDGYYSSVSGDKGNIVRTEDGFIGEADPPFKRGSAPLGTSAGQRQRAVQKKVPDSKERESNVPFKHDEDDHLPPRETTNNRGRDRSRDRENKVAQKIQASGSGTGWAQGGSQLEKPRAKLTAAAADPAFTAPPAAPAPISVPVKITSKPKTEPIPVGPTVQVDAVRVLAALRRETNQLNKLLQVRDFMGNGGNNASSGDEHFGDDNDEEDSIATDIKRKSLPRGQASDINTRIAVLKDRKLCLEQALDSARGASTVRMAERDLRLFPLLCTTSTKASIQQEKEREMEFLAEGDTSPSSHQRLKAGAHINTAAVKLLLPIKDNGVGKDRISSMVQPLLFPSAFSEKVASYEERLRVDGIGSVWGIGDNGDAAYDVGAKEDDRWGGGGGYNGVIDHNRGGQARARHANSRPSSAPSQRGRKQNVPKSIRSPQAKEHYMKEANRRGELFVPSYSNRQSAGGDRNRSDSGSRSPSPSSYQHGSRSPSPIEVVLPSRLRDRQPHRRQEPEGGRYEDSSNYVPKRPPAVNPRHASNPEGHDSNLYQQLDDVQHHVPQLQQKLEPRHQKIELLQRNDWRGGDESNTNDYHRDQDREAQKVYAAHDRRVHYDSDAQPGSAAIQKPPRPNTADAPALRRRDMQRPGTRPSTGGVKATYVLAKDAGRSIDALEYEPTGLLVRGLFRNLDHAYDSREKLPPATDRLSKERAAIIDMFGFNANANRRFHRQAPVSSGAAYERDPDSNQYVAVNKDGEKEAKEPRGFRLY